MKQTPTLSIQRPYDGREALAAMNGASQLGLSYVRSSSPIQGTVPVGTVEFCEPVFGKQPRVKKFYPEFLSPLISRNIYLIGCNDPIDTNNPWFVKAATCWKASEPASITSLIRPGSWWVSRLVEFTQEWRYYVADGCLLATGWYDGIDQEETAPSLNIQWPAGFSGAVDVGRLSNGSLELVETHAPFGCGWYGDSKHNDLFTLWLVKGWNNRSFWLEKIPPY